MMGSLFDFLLEPALEAGSTDITKDVDSEKNAIIKGGSKDAPQDDMSKTNDIFGLKDKGSDGGNDSPDDTPDDNGGSDTDDPAETPDDDTDAGDDGGDDSSNGEDPSQSDDSSQNDDDDQEDISKSPFDTNQLRDNMIIFYRIISSNLDGISSAVGRCNDPNLAMITNRVSANMESIKTVLFNTITKDMKTQPYEKSMKIYVTCRRIYDICIQMLSKYTSSLNLKK